MGSPCHNQCFRSNAHWIQTSLTHWITLWLAHNCSKRDWKMFLKRNGRKRDNILKSAKKLLKEAGRFCCMFAMWQPLVSPAQPTSTVKLYHTCNFKQTFKDDKEPHVSVIHMRTHASTWLGRARYAHACIKEISQSPFIITHIKRKTLAHRHKFKLLHIKRKTLASVTSSIGYQCSSCTMLVVRVHSIRALVCCCVIYNKICITPKAQI